MSANTFYGWSSCVVRLECVWQRNRLHCDKSKMSIKWELQTKKWFFFLVSSESTFAANNDARVRSFVRSFACNPISLLVRLLDKFICMSTDVTAVIEMRAQLIRNQGHSYQFSHTSRTRHRLTFFLFPKVSWKIGVPERVFLTTTVFPSNELSFFSRFDDKLFRSIICPSHGKRLKMER